MKAYVVMETYRDWEDGWDNLCGIFLTQDKAVQHMVNLQAENKDERIEFSVLEEEIFE